MSVNTSERLSTSQWVKWIITFGVPLIIFFMPVTEVFTHEIKWFCIITVWTLLCSAFELLDLYIPSILLPVLYVMAGGCNATVAYSSWTTLVVFNIIGAMLLANVLESIGLLNRIAFWIIRKCGGTFNGAVWGLFFAGLIISFITFANGYVVIATLSYGVCKALGVSRNKEACIVMMSGMLAASTVRMFIFSPVTVGLCVTGAQTVDPTFDINIVNLTVANLPVLLYCMLFIFLMTVVCKTKHSSFSGGKTYFDQEYAKLGKMSSREKKAAVVLALLIVYIFTQPLHGLNTFYGFIVFPCLLFFPGIQVGSSANIKGLPFSTILFVAACLAIGAVGTSLGIMQMISAMLAPQLTAMGTIGALYGIMTLGVLVNLLMTPAAMLSVLPAPVMQICMDAGLSGRAAMYTMIFSTDLVFLPYEYVTFLIFFSFGVMSTGQFLKYHAIKNLLFYVFFGLMIVPYWYLIGLI